MIANGLGTLRLEGLGPNSSITAPQTVVDAILDALVPPGIEHLDMPATAERVWRAIRAAHIIGNGNPT